MNGPVAPAARPPGPYPGRDVRGRLGEIPLAMTSVLKRLQVSTKLQAGWRSNMGRISELKASGHWQNAGKELRKRAKAKAEKF